MASMILRRARRKAELQSGMRRKYNFTREYEGWHTQHCLLVGLGLFVDTIAESKPGRSCGAQLSMLVAGISFARLFLKLWEKNEPQLWTWPNLVTALRIFGLIGAALYKFEKDSGESMNNRDSNEQPRAPESISDGHLAILGLIFVGMDFLDGFLARWLDQSTALGAHIDGQADALATAFVAFRLRCCGSFGPTFLSPLLGLHLAAAPYVWHLVTVAPFTPKRLAKRCAALRHPWARPAAGLMAFFVILALAIPAISHYLVPAVSSAPLATAGTPLSLFNAAEMLFSSATTGRDSNGVVGGHQYALLLHLLARFFANAAGIINIVSFGLSYLVLFGPLLGINSFGVVPHPDDKGEAAATARQNKSMASNTAVPSHNAQEVGVSTQHKKKIT